MPIVFTTTGLADMLGAYTERLASPGYKLRLFSNDLVPVETNVAADFVECAFNGYVPLDLTDWGNGPTATLPTVVTWGSLFSYEFTKAIGPIHEYAYGWYITSAAGDVVLADRFPARAVFDAPLDDIKIKMLLTIAG